MVHRLPSKKVIYRNKATELVFWCTHDYKFKIEEKKAFPKNVRHTWMNRLATFPGDKQYTFIDFMEMYSWQRQRKLYGNWNIPGAFYFATMSHLQAQFTCPKIMALSTGDTFQLHCKKKIKLKHTKRPNTKQTRSVAARYPLLCEDWPVTLLVDGNFLYSQEIMYEGI